MKVSFLLASLVLMIMIYPFLQGGGWNEVILQVLFTGTLLGGIYAISADKWDRAVSFALAMLTLATTWGAILSGTDSILLMGYVFSGVFYSFTIARILGYVLNAGQVDHQVIYAAISAYLLLGITWGIAYLTVDHLDAGAFIAPYKQGGVERGDLLYFSYVTLTTTGYGDIIARSSAARSLAVLESMTGVLYVAVMITRLVAVYHGRKG
jgi:hypothetical protein